MPNAPDPTPQEVRDFLGPIGLWSDLRELAEKEYRDAVVRAHIARIPVVHIARYADAKPQAISKTLERRYARITAERRHSSL